MIEFLFWKGCPSHERALDRLREELRAQGISEDELRVTEVTSREEAERRRFPGSPTIQLDGVDAIDPGDASYGLDCRLYHHRDGRPSPLPDPDDLKEALQRYATKGK